MGADWLTIFLGQELMSDNAVFSHLIEKQGNIRTKNQNVPTGKEITSLEGWKATADPVQDVPMQEEERNTGAVNWDIYKYLKSAGGILWAPVIGALLLLVEGNNGRLFYSAEFLSQLLFNSRHFPLLGFLDREYDLPVRGGRLHGGLYRP